MKRNVLYRFLPAAIANAWYALLAIPMLAVGAEAGVTPRWLSFTARVSVETTDPKGKVTRQPTIVARTIVRGDSARADIVEGTGDFRPGDVLVTYDGGHTLYIVHPAKREYSVIKVDSLGEQLRLALKGGKLKAKADSVSIGFERTGVAQEDSVSGMPTQRARITRRFRLTVQVLLLKKRIQTQETLDLWLSPEHAQLPNPLGGLFVALLDAPSHANEELTRGMLAINDSLGPGAPLRVVHRLVTGRAKDESVTVTTIETLDLTAMTTDAARFDVFTGYRRNDR